jgi:hypothetical protein
MYILLEKTRSLFVFPQTINHKTSLLVYQPLINFFESSNLMFNAKIKTYHAPPSTASFQVPRPNFPSDHLKMSSQNQTSQPAYAESTYSTSTTYSEKPLMKTSSSEQRQSKRSKAWQKTKELLAKIPEPEREQKPAVVGPETEEEKLKRMRKFGELDYGTYQGGPHCGPAWHR